MSHTYTLQYFAILREQARCREERITTPATTPGELYAEVRTRHGFTLEPNFLRVAVNDEFVPWDTLLRNGDHIVFIPPVAGG